MSEQYVALATTQLKKCDVACKMIANIEGKIDEVCDDLYGLKSIDYSGMPKGGGQVSYALEHLILKKQSLELDIQKAYEIINITNNMIKGFTCMEKQVIATLMKGECLKELAEEIFVSRATVYRTRKNALLKLGEIIYKSFSEGGANE